MSEMACIGRVGDPACVSSSPPLSPSPPSPFSPAAIAIIAVLGVAFLVVSYYTIISKFCPPWGRLWGSRRLSLRRRGGGSSSVMEARWVEAGGGAIIWPVFPTRGLEESAIRAIPILQHCRKKSADGGSLAECAVCLGELADGEWLRQLPQCCHAFHIACIDEWLQSHSSCPLCRAGVLSHAASLENRQISPQSSDLTDSSSLAAPPDPPVNLVVAAVAPPSPLPELQLLNNPILSISHSERYTAIPNGSSLNHLWRSYSTSFLNESTDPALMELRRNDPTLTRVNDDSSSILPLSKENGDGKPSAPPPNPSFRQTSLSDRKLFAFLSGNRFSSSSSSSWVRTSRTSGHVHPIDDSIV